MTYDKMINEIANTMRERLENQLYDEADWVLNYMLENGEHPENWDEDNYEDVIRMAVARVSVVKH